MFGKMDGLGNVPESPLMPQEKGRVTSGEATPREMTPASRPSSATTADATDTGEDFKDLTPDQIVYLKKFSIAAFFAAPVWALCNKLYWHALISIIFGQMGGTIFMGIYLGSVGRREAWKRGWPSFDAFRERQSWTAKICAGAIFAVIFIGVLSALVNSGAN